MRKIVIILYGPPGAGKGTQANLLADKLQIYHMDTGRYLEALIYNPKRQNQAVIKRERAAFDAGKLMTPSFVTREITREIKRLARADWGIILSGSPRTMYEAEREFPEFEKLYGKKNIFVFEISVDPEDSLRRNSARMVCKKCGYLFLSSFYPEKHPRQCPVCGGPFYKRSLDNRKVIKVRLREYKERTEPIFDFLDKRGYKVVRVNGRPAPYKVMEKIYDHVKNTGRN